MTIPTTSESPRPTVPRRPTLLGAYAMAPADPDAEAELYAAVAGLDVGGLEVPVLTAASRAAQPEWFDRNVRPEWDLLATCIPTVMGRRATDAGYGLASSDDDARRRALADVAVARDLALRLADQHGRRRVVAVQVHSAPGPQAGSADALARSLTEILGWDLAGAAVLVEHCDALVPGQAPSKGFLTLEDEIAAIRQALGDAAPAGPGAAQLGVSINWGRSAIEGRSARAALAHVDAAAQTGLLRALVLSGATDVETAWGPAWADAHIPPRGEAPALAASQASLLGAGEIGAALGAAGPDCLVAVKVAVRPKDADVATRLAVARAAVELVDGLR